MMNLFLLVILFQFGCTLSTDTSEKPARSHYSGVFKYQGILFDEKKNSDRDSWDIQADAIGPMSLITVHARRNQGFMWQVASYYVSDNGVVKIIDDSRVDHGYEYRILVYNK